jgi:hypothetical protein
VHADGGDPWLLTGYMALSGVITAVCTLFLKETAPRAIARRAARKGTGGTDAGAPLDVAYAEG